MLYIPNVASEQNFNLISIMKKLFTFLCVVLLSVAVNAQNNCDLELKLTSHTNWQVINFSCEDTLSVILDLVNNGPDTLVVDAPFFIPITSSYDSAWYESSNTRRTYHVMVTSGTYPPNTTVGSIAIEDKIDNMDLLFRTGVDTMIASVDTGGHYPTARYICEFYSRFLIDTTGISPYWQYIDTVYTDNIDSTNNYQYLILDVTRISLTGVNDHNHDKLNVNIYPNPVQNGTASFDFELDRNEIATIRVTDATGRTVLTQKVKGTGLTTIKLDVSNLSEGLYNIEIASENKRGVSKFTIAQ